MDKLDFLKQEKDLYFPPNKVVVEVTVPVMRFLMVDGQGDPNGPEFEQAIGALYSVAYSLKFWSKKHAVPSGYQDFAVAPLEALWSVAGTDSPEAMNAPREQWRWTALMRQPEFVTKDLLAEVVKEVTVKKPNPKLTELRLETFAEGLSVQIMHIGPYTEERPTLEKLEAYLQANNYISNGKHHEIYLGDPRRSAPDKLKTVLRHPVRKK